MMNLKPVLVALGILLICQPSMRHCECSTCLLCTRNGVNLPRDIGTLREGLDEYPARIASQAGGDDDGETDSLEQEAKSCPYSNDDAKKLLNSVNRVVSFYEKNYLKITMRSDGGIGLGVLKGQLDYLLANREDKLSPPVKTLLENLQRSSGPIALAILDQAIEAMTDPSKRYGGQVIRNNTKIVQARHREWHGSKVITGHFDEFKNIGDEKEVVYPYLDFHCLVTLIESCDVPEVCRKMYLTDVYSQYMLMHQVIYQQFATRRSCIAATKNQEAFGNAQEMQDRLCAKAYLEAEFLEKHNFPTRFIGLFAEQVGFCGQMGYPNFLKSSWLREILSWQTSESGCFPDHYKEKEQVDAIIKTEVATGGEENCLVHLTSVSLMAFSVNLRFMMDNCSPNIFDGYSNNFISA